MTAISIQALPSCAPDADRLAARLGVSSSVIDVHAFPDGEIRVTVGPVTATTIIYASLDRPNDKLIALLLAAEALRREGCRHLVLLAPYLCYMRQDAAFHRGEAISQKAIGGFLAGLFDRIITVDAHLHRTSDLATVFPNVPVENLSAIPAIAKWIRTSGLDPATVLIGPDAESRQWVGRLAESLGLACSIASKVRRGDRSVSVEFSDRAAIAGRPALIVDDIVSSGETLKTCASALSAAGASAIDALVTHALFPTAMLAEFAEAGIRHVRSTHSVPHPTNAVPLDDLFADALKDEREAFARKEIPA